MTKFEYRVVSCKARSSKPFNFNTELVLGYLQHVVSIYVVPEMFI
jgi:hypothetical protein